MSTTPPPAPAAPSGPRPPRRNQARDIHEAHRVATPLELLFDLVFVVAIAQSAAQLDHGVLAHHTAQAVGGYLLAFGAIWWAWINYTWFASAYDDDSTAFRLLTLLQMGGVLLLATGIPGMFEGQFLAPVLGYVVMRLALGVQWLRAGRGDPARRRTCRRYATGIALVQAGWVLFLL
ncbi:MAG TPA: low temperature requirement protein A, partial [Ottowia sp.]|nr:low temperature requirement protein A [Ottowia sp.]